MTSNTLHEISDAIRNKKSFLVEAGAGKTTALIDTIKNILENNGDNLRDKKQKIACITYTKRAAENIREKTENHPFVVVNTLHAFFWSVISKFQQELKKCIINSGSWIKRWESKYKEGVLQKWHLSEFDEYSVIYNDIAARIVDCDKKELILHHDDILDFVVELLDYPKFRNIFTGLYPYILIDEYQDTKLKLAQKIINCLELDDDSMPVIGFYGDAWQKIYSDGIGEINSSHIIQILKLENFRSSIAVVNALNNIRKDFIQNEQRKHPGSAKVYHTNSLTNRRTENHWKGDLVEDLAVDIIESIKTGLGWDFEEIDPETGKPINKILYLTHKLISRDINYQGLLDSFQRKEDLIELKDPVVSFFIEKIEPIYQAYLDRNYAVILKLNKNKYLRSHNDKKGWTDFFIGLKNIREKGNVGEVIEFIHNSKRIVLPDKIELLLINSQETIEQEITDRRSQGYLGLKEIPYSEIVNFSKFINDSTVLSTQHGVKGEEYKSVLVILGGGWNQYNWDNFLAWSNKGVPKDKENAYIRNRNLFYVSCSRARDNLVLLFTQELSVNSLKQIEIWFKKENIESYRL